MFGLPSLKIGTLFGIPLEVDASWFVILFLVASTLTTSYFPAALPDRDPVTYTALGLVTALAFFGSLVLHELAHSLVARAGGLRISRVTPPTRATAPTPRTLSSALLIVLSTNHDSASSSMRVEAMV